jgi:hydroxyacyl-ACP dehydratase HTD2-like protein with hotdog domain
MAASNDAEWQVATTGHVVEAGAIRRMAAALEDENPLWSSVAPPTFVDSFNPFYAGEPYPVWPDDLPYSFSAGDEFVLHAPIVAGDVLDVDCRIASDSEKLRSDGSSRIRLVTYEKLYRRAGELVAEERWICAFFEGARNTSRRAEPPAPRPGAERLEDQVREITPLRIVRWASAIGDFERSHFDHRYATETCGLPDVVGHGPYSGALLLKPVTDHLGATGRVSRATFAYRSASYPGDRITYSAWRDPGETEYTLAAVKEDGTVVTTGTCRTVATGP